MSQIITTPDGVEHEFPDAASDDVIKNTLKSYSGGSSQTAPSTAMPAALTYDAPNPNASTGEKILSLLHNFSAGLGQSTRAAEDYATHGYGDVLQAKVENALSGPTVAGVVGQQITGQSPEQKRLAELRSQSQQAHTNMGYADLPIGIATSMVGPGMKAPAAVADATRAALANSPKLANLAGYGAGALTSGGVSAADAALGTLGHGGSADEAGKSAIWGGTIGTLLGMLPGGSSGPRPSTPSTADLDAVAAGRYATLTKKYNSPDVAAAIDRGGANVSQGLQSKMSSSLSDQIDRIKGIVAKGGGTTASDIADFRSSLMGAARNDVDKTIAGQYLAELDKGVGPQMAANIKSASGASNVAKTSADIEGWAARPYSAPAKVKSALENKPNFYKTQPGLYEGLEQIAKKAPDTDPTDISDTVGKAITRHLLSAAATGTAGYVAGGSPWEGLASAVGGAFLPTALNKVRAMPTRNSLLALQHLNATGDMINPGSFTSNWLRVPGVLARQTNIAAGSAGDY